MTPDTSSYDLDRPVVPPSPAVWGFQRRFRWSGEDRLLPQSPFMHTCMVALPVQSRVSEPAPACKDSAAPVRLDIVASADPDLIARIAGLLSKFGMMPDLMTVRRVASADGDSAVGVRLIIVVSPGDRGTFDRMVNGCRKIIGVFKVLVNAQEH